MLLTMSETKNYRRPESVLIVVHTRFGEVLLLKRGKPFDFWQSVTGSLEYGEDHAAAAVRELSEETGIVTGSELVFTGRAREFEIDPRWLDRYAPGVTHNTEYEWQLCLDDVSDVQLRSGEHVDYCWTPMIDAVEQVWSWTNKEAIRELLKTW